MSNPDRDLGMYVVPIENNESTITSLVRPLREKITSFKNWVDEFINNEDGKGCGIAIFTAFGSFVGLGVALLAANSVDERSFGAANIIRFSVSMAVGGFFGYLLGITIASGEEE